MRVQVALMQLAVVKVKLWATGLKLIFNFYFYFFFLLEKLFLNSSLQRQALHLTVIKFLNCFSKWDSRAPEAHSCI